MGFLDTISSWLDGFKAKGIASKAKGEYALEIKFLKELADDLTLLINLASSEKVGNMQDILISVFRIHQKLTRLERRADHDEQKAVNRLVSLTSLHSKLPKSSVSHGHLEIILGRLQVEEKALIGGLSAMGGVLGIDLNKVKGEEKLIERFNQQPIKKVSQAFGHFKVTLHKVLSEVQDLIKFAHAAIIDLGKLEEEAINLSRRKFIQGALMVGGAAAVVAATMRYGKLFEEARSLSLKPGSENRAVFLVNSKDGKEFVAIKLRPNWSFSNISKFYCKDSSASTIKILKEFNPKKYNTGDYLFFPSNLANIIVLKYLREGKFLHSTLEEGMALHYFVETSLARSHVKIPDRFKLLIAFSLSLPYTIPRKNETLNSHTTLVIPQSLYPVKVNENFEVPNLEKYAHFQSPTKQSWADIEPEIKLTHHRKARRVRIGGEITKHYGFDWPGPVGAEIYSLGFGVVERIRTNWKVSDRKNKTRNWRTGNNVVIRLFYKGMKVQFLHLDKVFVKKGQQITLNTQLGTLGITGNAQAHNPHVHISMYKKSGGVTDPTPYVRGDMNTNFKEFIKENMDAGNAIADAIFEEEQSMDA